ncbi:AAA family ATPase [Streptomyces sp. NPDC051907]|uniref:helix-turn-helix transcriptional regulator n=1 Tax=Streptomyces sp. NPDC051907 TaxID=3155284 RepID=UPI003415DBF5
MSGTPRGSADDGDGTAASPVTGQPARDRGAAARDLMGRERLLARISGVLAGHAPEGPALLMRGEPGVGKSALLDAAAGYARAHGARVVRTSGVECEAGLAFSGLHQLLHPLRNRAGSLTAGQQYALDRAFGLGAGDAPDRMAVSVAALALLTNAAADAGTLLLVVDDVQWVDRSSAEVLAFLARRLDAGLAFLGASRPGAGGVFDGSGLPEAEVPPLDPDAARRLLEASHPGLPTAVRDRLLKEAAGNPLALVELPTALSARQLLGREMVPASLPLSGRLERLYADRVRDLSPATRRLLLVAALEGAGGLETVHAAAGDDWDVHAVNEAELAGLIRVDGGRLVFRHPLIRSAIAQASPPHARRAAHQALADALPADPERRAWHLAGSVVESDERIAQALEDAGERSVERGGAAAAVPAFLRAAELSPRREDRARRLSAAAYAAGQSGQLDYSARLLAEADQLDGGGAEARDTGIARAYLLMHQEGDLDGAHRLLVRCLGERLPAEQASRTAAPDEAMYILLFVCYFAARADLWASYDAALKAMAPQSSDLTRLYRDAVVATTEQASSLRERLDVQFAAVSETTDPWRVARLGLVAQQIDAIGDYRDRIRGALRDRPAGTQASRLTGAILLVTDDFLAGRWDSAEALVADQLDLAHTAGYQLLGCLLRGQAALLAAARGRSDVVDALVHEVVAWAGPRGIEMPVAAARYAQVLDALGRGRYEEACAWAAQISAPGTLPYRSRYGPMMVLDVVEAAVRCGRLDDAREHLGAVRRAGVHRVSSRTALVVAGAEALCAPEAEQGAAFEKALSIEGGRRWPFEYARVQLLYGESLRRMREAGRARDQLWPALRSLESLGAAPWAERARNELRATGLHVTRHEGRSPLLTAQETQIATLAAGGLTNKQIAERMHLSHRTVSSHLYKIFPKLGITSRAALRDALTAPSTTSTPATAASATAASPP